MSSVRVTSAPLDGRDARAHGARERERQHGEHAIRLDLEQALHHATRLLRREVAIEEQEALEAIGVHAEVGEREAATATDLGADHDVAAEGGLHEGRIGLAGRGEERGMRGEERRARDLFEPTGGKRSDGRLAERRGACALREERVARELAVPLPLAAKRGQVGAEVSRVGGRRREPEVLAQAPEVGELVVALLGRHDDGEVRRPRRRGERHRRPRVHFLRQRQALRMVRRDHVGPSLQRTPRRRARFRIIPCRANLRRWLILLATRRTRPWLHPA